jgi:hypothetical protein
VWWLNAPGLALNKFSVSDLEAEVEKWRRRLTTSGKKRVESSTERRDVILRTPTGSGGGMRRCLTTSERMAAAWLASAEVSGGDGVRSGGRPTSYDKFWRRGRNSYDRLSMTRSKEGVEIALRRKRGGLAGDQRLRRARVWSGGVVMAKGGQ